MMNAVWKRTRKRKKRSLTTPWKEKRIAR